MTSSSHYIIFIIYLYRDNGKWGWFIWRIRYQLTALVAIPQEPTSRSCPWTRPRYTGVIWHVPLKVLPRSEFQSYFIGYLTRPLGFFFAFIDTEKSSRAHSGAMPRRTGRILGSYLRKVLRHSEIKSWLRCSENILSSAFFGCWNSTFIRVSGWLILF